jgi:hypothetical protein
MQVFPLAQFSSVPCARHLRDHVDAGEHRRAHVDIGAERRHHPQTWEYRNVATTARISLPPLRFARFSSLAEMFGSPCAGARFLW